MLDQRELKKIMMALSPEIMYSQLNGVTTCSVLRSNATRVTPCPYKVISKARHVCQEYWQTTSYCGTI